MDDGLIIKLAATHRSVAGCMMMGGDGVVIKLCSTYFVEFQLVIVFIKSREKNGSMNKIRLTKSLLPVNKKT